MELKEDKYRKILHQFTLLGSHSLNLTWDKINLKVDNLYSIFGNIEELKVGNSLEEILPDKSKKNNENDRGIYGDAIFEKCDVILHENPKDFSKFENDAKKRNILIINLLEINANDVIKSIKQLNII